MTNTARPFERLDRWLLRRIVPAGQRVALLRLANLRCLNCGDAATDDKLCAVCAAELRHDRQVEEEMRHGERDERR